MAAAPLMSVAAPLWFWKFWKKILDFGIFFRNFENYENFELKFPKQEANFDAERGIWRENLCQVERHSAARLATMMHASGSSAFTWKIGAFTTRPTSVQ